MNKLKIFLDKNKLSVYTRNKKKIKYGHTGVDIVINSNVPTVRIYCFKGGKVTKLGYTYSDDLNYRYVEIEDKLGARLRYFYVSPAVEVGDIVKAFSFIGRSQDVCQRYNTKEKKMTPHIHFEVKVAGKIVDPMPYLKEAGLKVI